MMTQRLLPLQDKNEPIAYDFLSTQALQRRRILPQRPQCIQRRGQREGHRRRGYFRQGLRAQDMIISRSSDFSCLIALKDMAANNGKDSICHGMHYQRVQKRVKQRNTNSTGVALYGLAWVGRDRLRLWSVILLLSCREWTRNNIVDTSCIEGTIGASSGKHGILNQQTLESAIVDTSLLRRFFPVGLCYHTLHIILVDYSSCPVLLVVFLVYIRRSRPLLCWSLLET